MAQWFACVASCTGSRTGSNKLSQEKASAAPEAPVAAKEAAAEKAATEEAAAEQAAVEAAAAQDAASQKAAKAAPEPPVAAEEAERSDAPDAPEHASMRTSVAGAATNILAKGRHSVIDFKEKAAEQAAVVKEKAAEKVADVKEKAAEKAAVVKEKAAAVKEHAKAKLSRTCSADEGHQETVADRKETFEIPVATATWLASKKVLVRSVCETHGVEIKVDKQPQQGSPGKSMLMINGDPEDRHKAFDAITNLALRCQKDSASCSVGNWGAFNAATEGGQLDESLGETTEACKSMVTDHSKPAKQRAPKEAQWNPPEQDHMAHGHKASGSCHQLRQALMARCVHRQELLDQGVLRPERLQASPRFDDPDSPEGVHHVVEDVHGEIGHAPHAWREYEVEGKFTDTMQYFINDSADHSKPWVTA